MPSFRLHHVTITVQDRYLSAQWYENLFGTATRTELTGAGWNRIRLQWPEGQILGITEHDRTASNSRFDESNIGADHIGFLTDSKEAVQWWANRADELGIERGQVEDAPYAWAVTLRDPDNIPIEFICYKN